jgi:hypothetical protein
MSYRPLTLYDPDSDDSSSDGGSIGGRPHASMGIANDNCRRDNDSDRFSLDSALFEGVDDDEMDDPMLRPQHYNPSNLRVEMGKRVGVDSGDDSDGDGEHYGRDRDFKTPSARTHLKVSGDIDEHSIGSDDDYMPAVHKTFPKRITRNDAQFDGLVPTGNPREETTGGAGEPTDAFKEGKDKYTEPERKGKEAVAKAEKKGKRDESKRLVAEALTKARESSDPRVKLQLERRAVDLAKGQKTGKVVIKGGKTVEERAGTLAGATLSPAVKEKGMKALTKLGKNLATEKGVQKGKLAEQFDEKQKMAMGEARTRKAKSSVLKDIGRESKISKLVETRLKSKALAKLLSNAKTLKARREAGKKIVEALKTSLAKTKAEAQIVSRLVAERLAKERADTGGSEVSGGGGGGETTVASNPSPTETGDTSKATKIQLSDGNALELQSYGNGVSVLFNGERIGNSQEDLGMVESLLTQIREKYGTGYALLRKKLGVKAYNIKTALKKVKK